MPTISPDDAVIPLFKEQRKKGVVTLTDNDMTRFSISLEDGVNMVLWTIQNSLGGEIVVPKVPSFGIRELAKRYRKWRTRSSFNPNISLSFIQYY